MDSARNEWSALARSLSVLEQDLESGIGWVLVRCTNRASVVERAVLAVAELSRLMGQHWHQA